MAMIWLGVAAIVVWLACGVLGYGLECAYWKSEWPVPSLGTRGICHRCCLMVAFMGPVGLAVFYFEDGFSRGLSFDLPERMKRCEKQ